MQILRPTLELKMDSSVVTVAFLVPASSIVVPPLTWFRKKHVGKTFGPLLDILNMHPWEFFSFEPSNVMTYPIQKFQEINHDQSVHSCSLSL